MSTQAAPKLSTNSILNKVDDDSWAFPVECTTVNIQTFVHFYAQTAQAKRIISDGVKGVYPNRRQLGGDEKQDYPRCKVVFDNGTRTFEALFTKNGSTSYTADFGEGK